MERKEQNHKQNTLKHKPRLLTFWKLIQSEIIKINSKNYWRLQKEKNFMKHLLKAHWNSLWSTMDVEISKTSITKEMKRAWIRQRWGYYKLNFTAA